MIVNQHQNFTTHLSLSVPTIFVLQKFVNALTCANMVDYFYGILIREF